MADEKTCPHCGKPVPPTALGGICPECMLKAGLATQTEGPGGTGPHGTRVIHPPPTPAEIASLFPQLEILECLGRGGMGVVYKARQPRLNRFVALKILAREKEQDAQFAERFTREAQALARLNHPNIVTVHDFGEAGGHCYLVMEFVDGLNLRQLLQTRKMPSEQALTIVPKICEALQYAHEQGVVHRDIKPENILLGKSGRVKIADFGIAKMLGDETGQQTLTGARDAVGTPHYMAPEQIEKPLTVDHRADIYSLGVVFYEMLTGELPLGRFAPPSKKVQIDVRLDEVVLHALEKEPDRRYQQASQVKTAVETIAAASEPDAGRRREVKTEPAEGQSRPMLAAAAFRRGARVGLWVFLLIVFAASLITFLLPTSYLGTARVELTGLAPQSGNPYYVQTEFQVIESDSVLEGVVDSLKLDQRWGKKFNGGTPLNNAEVMALMRSRIDLRPIRNTDVIEIGFFSSSPKEAAEIANKIAETYCALPPGHRGAIIERAAAPFHPVRPNVPLNIFIGIVAGSVIGIVVGLGFGLFSFWRLRAVQSKVSPPARKPDRFWRFIVIVFVVIPTLGLLGNIALQNLIKPRNEISPPSQSFYIGQTWFPQGDSIETTSVERNENQMTVKGHYHLVSHDHAELALYITSTNQNVPEDATQRMEISKGQGDFELIHSHVVPGLPHVEMYANGKVFASLYFGTKAEALEESKTSWITNAQSSLGPMILKVTVQTNAAFLLGQTRDGGELVLTIGSGGLSWSNELKANMLFGAVVRPDRDELRFDVSSGTGPTSSTIQNRIALAPASRIPRGTWIFHEGTYGPTSENIVIADLLTAAGESLPVSVSVRKPEALSPQALSFGPVIERVVPDHDWFDLDSGTIIPADVIPDHAEEAVVDYWIHKTGADFKASVSDHSLLARGCGLLDGSEQGIQWESATPETVADLISKERADKVVETIGIRPTDKPPATSAFCTREGRLGLLQITGFTENPRGVKIRYKLVQPATTAQAASASALQFRLVLPPDSTASAEDVLSVSRQNRFHLSRRVLLDDTAIARAGVDFGPDGQRRIKIQFTGTGAKQFEAITATNIGRQLAIVFRNQVLSAPVIQSVIPNGQCQVDGSMNANEINEIVDCLNRTTTPTAVAWAFSPGHERILPFKPLPDALPGWLDLDSGIVLTNFSLDLGSRSGYEWIRSNGLDVVTAESAKHFPGLLGLDIIIAPAPSNGWNTVTVADVVNNWSLLQEEPQQKNYFGAMPGQSDTFFFQTREGGKGILQILGFADNPPGVKIRYRLVHATGHGEVIDPTTGLPTVHDRTEIDPHTGLPMVNPNGTGNEIDPTTGLPITPNRTEIDPTTGLPTTSPTAGDSTGASTATGGIAPLSYQWYFSGTNPPATGNRMRFGPVIERFVESSSRPPYDEYSYLDLDTGRLLSLGQVKPPVDPFNVEQFYDWRQKSGADVVAQIVNDSDFPRNYPAKLKSVFRGLVGLNTTLLPVDKSTWESMSPQAVVALVAPVKVDTTRWTMATTLTNGLPATHLFKTSEGGMGLLQITGFTEQPPGVQIRYKLVQAADSKAQPSASALESADLGEAKARLAELAVDYSPQNPVYLRQQARIQALEKEAKEHPDESADLREAKAHLAELRVDYSEQHPAVQTVLARVKELERMTKEEPNASADLREAKAHLAELRVDYSEHHPLVQKALAKVKVLEQSNAATTNSTQP